MPAEWERQDGIILAWPHNREDWPDKFEPIPFVYTEIIRHIARQERVRLIVRHAKDEEKARTLCQKNNVDMARIDIYTIPTNRIWMRDSGPIFVRDPKSERYMLDWGFNAWAKYPNHKLDNNVPLRLNATYHLPRIEPRHKNRRVILEGGSIDVNGKGVLLTTEECLLSSVQERNPGFSRSDYEETFHTYLGITHTIWLGNGIAGDDTHGHVDDLSRFTDASTVVTVVESNPNDANYAPLQDNLQRLRNARDQDGKQLNVVTLPMPSPIFYEGQLLPASYANFLICNDLVLVPTFNDPADRIALSTLAELFPSREVVGIHAVDLVWGLGTIHCMSQQEPAAS